MIQIWEVLKLSVQVVVPECVLVQGVASMLVKMAQVRELPQQRVPMNSKGRLRIGSRIARKVSVSNQDHRQGTQDTRYWVNI